MSRYDMDMSTPIKTAHDAIDELYATCTSDYEYAQVDDALTRAGLLWDCDMCAETNRYDDERCGQCERPRGWEPTDD